MQIKDDCCKALSFTVEGRKVLQFELDSAGHFHIITPLPMSEAAASFVKMLKDQTLIPTRREAKMDIILVMALVSVKIEQAKCAPNYEDARRVLEEIQDIIKECLFEA